MQEKMKNNQPWYETDYFFEVKVTLARNRFTVGLALLGRQDARHREIM